MSCRKNLRKKRLILYEKQGKRCFWCNRKVLFEEWESPDFFTVDHVVSLSNGGTNEWSNLVGACHGCNQARDREERYRNLEFSAAPFSEALNAD